MRRTLIITCILLAAVLFIMFLSVDIATPRSNTRAAIGSIMYHRIPEYLKQHHQLPDRLADIPTVESYNDCLTDGWGRDIMYFKNSDGTYTLLSYGKDGKPGGTGENADIQETFNVSELTSEITRRTLGVIAEVRIPEYIKMHHKLPNDLRELPIIPREDNRIQNAWGREIIYQRTSDKTFTLSSLGRNREPGGNGMDADIIANFNVRYLGDKIHPAEVEKITTTSVPTSKPCKAI